MTSLNDGSNSSTGQIAATTTSFSANSGCVLEIPRKNAFYGAKDSDLGVFEAFWVAEEVFCLVVTQVEDYHSS